MTAVKEPAAEVPLAEGQPAVKEEPAASSQQDGQSPAGGMQAGSKLSGGTASGGSARPAGRVRGGSKDKDGEESGVLVAGKEVVGRQVAVFSAKQGDWPKAIIAQFNAATRQHLLRYVERPPGAVKHHEEWASLERTRFQWVADPAPQAAANPSWAAAPRGDEAVHTKVRVFWPAMARWYVGKIMAFDPKTKKHMVRYRDGDTQELNLKHQAVQYLGKEEPPARLRTDPRRGPGKQQAATGTAQKGGNGGSAKKAAGRGAKRAREGSAGGEADSVSGGGDDHKTKSQKSGYIKWNPDEDEADVGAPPAPAGGTPAVTPLVAAAPTTASPPKDAVAGSHEVSAELMGDSEEGQVDSQGGMGYSDDLPSSGMASEDLGSEVYISEEGLMEEEEEEDSDFEVESYRRGRRGGGAAARSAGGARSGSRRSGCARGGARRRSSGAGRRRSDGRGRPRGTPRRGEPRAPVAAPVLRKVLRADEETIRTAGAGIVGARVAMFWTVDESYYKGKLVQFDAYHKRHKVTYDDGEEEWVSLARESFRWLTPRARSAGCTPEYRTLMLQLGAEDCGGSASLGAAGVATRRQAHAAGAGGGTPVPSAGAAEASAPQAEACVGWQVSLLFDGDGQWYRGEVVGWDGRRGRALLLYDDGEDEWVELEQEALTWHCQLAGHSGVYPGLRGGPPPAERGALGWRVGVYWAADQAFYRGEVVGFDPTSGRHEVAYDDGEEGPINLGVDKIKWILPPGAAVDREKLEAADARGAGRRRGAAGDDSDPDYEAFEYRPRAPPRRSMQRLDGLSLTPTPMAGGLGVGRHHHWDLAAGAEASLAAETASAAPLARYPSLPSRPLPPAAVEAPQHLGQPVVVRPLTRAVGLAALQGAPEAAVLLPQPVTVRIYMSSTAGSTGSGASANTAVGNGGAAGAAAGAAAAPPAAAAPTQQETAAALQARLRALEQMSRRVSKAQQTIVKGVPTPLPSRRAVAAEAARAARSAAAAAAGVTSPTAAQRQQLLLGSSHASGLHRLARGSAVNYSPFHHKRPHPADSEGSTSSGSSEEEEEEKGDMGADSAEARRMHAAAAAAAGLDPSDPDGMPLSPRSLGALPKGGKVKPLGDEGTAVAGLAGGLNGLADLAPEGSTQSDGMLTAAPPALLGQQSPAMLSPFKAPQMCPATQLGGLGGGMGGGGSMGVSLVGSGGALLGDGGLPGMPHSSSLAGGMDALIAPLQMPLARRDSMAALMGGVGGGVGLPDSRNTSAMLGGGNLGLSDLDDTGTGGADGSGGALLGSLPSEPMDLDAPRG